MSDDEFSYYQTYQRTKANRRAEIGRLQRSLAERKPAARFILALFFGILGSTFVGFFPPIGIVFLIVAAVSGSSAVKLLGAHRNVRRALEDENYRWNLRDIAMSKLSPDGFETLGKAVAGGGSYNSATAYMKRRGLDEIECDVMILAASAAAEDMGLNHLDKKRDTELMRAIEREEATWKQAAAPKHPGARDESESESQAAPGDPASSEGLHAQLLQEEAASPPADEEKRVLEEFGR